jgi:hypothetical protein
VRENAWLAVVDHKPKARRLEALHILNIHFVPRTSNAVKTGLIPRPGAISWTNNGLGFSVVGDASKDWNALVEQMRRRKHRGNCVFVGGVHVCFEEN